MDSGWTRWRFLKPLSAQNKSTKSATNSWYYHHWENYHSASRPVPPTTLHLEHEYQEAHDTATRSERQADKQ